MINVSFIIIAYNEERNIARCLDSILKQNNLSDYEIIVVDDGSKDNTAKIVSDFPDKDQKIFLHKLQPNQGRGAARAAGVKVANGNYIAFIDADIVLPQTWLETCIDNINNFDAVGGIAVPDGDVNYVYTLFKLNPKTTKHSTTVTGSNGLFRKEVFSKLNFNSSLRDGEDVVFNFLLTDHGFKTKTIDSLIVSHRESKTFTEAAMWLFQSGIGATRQLKQFKKVRLPDLAFFIFFILLVFSILLYTYLNYVLILILPLLFIILTSAILLIKKFFFRASLPHKLIGSIVVFCPLLLSYFFGRLMGLFMPINKSLLETTRGKGVKKVLICIDFEGSYGMPMSKDYDILKSTDDFLSILDKYRVKAVFFIVGKLISEFPDLIKRISDHGHSIGLHGYNHEHLNTMNNGQLVDFEKNITFAEIEIEKITGKKPIAFRSPFLMGPDFFTAKLYSILEKHGYKWVSNREIRYSEELFRPDRISIKILWGKNNISTFIITLFLNAGLILKENIGHKHGLKRIFDNLKWLMNGAPPFLRGNIIEVPVYSPLDCDYFGLPDPNKPSSKNFLNYAKKSFIGGINRKGKYYSVNIHDWISFTQNRKDIISETLNELTKNRNVEFVTEINDNDVIKYSND